MSWFFPVLHRCRASIRPRPGPMALVSLALAWGAPAHAVPSYARQTGADCAACHVGAFGPQLTPYGIAFKLGAYSDTDGKGGKIPLSGMLLANWTHSAAPLTEVPDGFHDNNNRAVQETSVFLAGRLAESTGAFVQSTYSGVDRAWALDQFDLRHARSVRLGGREATLGLSLNGNPTLTDPFNTLGQWRFPYTSSDFGFGQGPTPLVENLGGAVAGLNVYTLWDRHLYAELGLYDTLSTRLIHAVHGADAGRFQGLAPYARVAWFEDRKRDNFSVGLLAFRARVLPDRDASSGADRYTDYGIDASYQYLGNRRDVWTVNASWIKERQVLDHGFGVEAAANRRNTLDNLRIAASYHRDQTWGATAAWFRSQGSADGSLYGASLNGRPDAAGVVLQADWTPWGKETSWAAPWANVRLGLQHTAYTRFEGGSSYVDESSGATRRARDNNTTMLFLWTAF